MISCLMHLLFGDVAAEARKLKRRNADLEKSLSVEKTKVAALEGTVESLRANLAVCNGSRDRANVKITAAIKALQS